ncbi:MAG: phytanoyl-CoA dioxygenase family protein [Pseudomonadales bacterium]
MNIEDALLTLDDGQRARFRRDGFLAIEKVTTDAELEWFRARYDELLENGPGTGFLDGIYDVTRPYGTSGPPELGQLLAPERFVRGLAKTLVFRNARRLAAGLLDVPEEALEVWTHLIFKPPHSAAITPWHQDEAYWDVHLDYLSVATWLPLDDVDEDNGCLWYLPGSHTGEVRRHRHQGGDPAVHILEVDEPLDTGARVPVPLSAGGLVLHHPRCLHWAGGNASTRTRRAWGIVCQTAPVPRAVPADRPWWHEGRAAHEASLAGR